MPAYIIVETDIHDPEQYERYKEAAPGAVAASGGRFWSAAESSASSKATGSPSGL